ncbi:unnamed protein product [Spirodela intermedia]|uniref:Peroxidase n=1 Tax=Spirodela intermedia TaxID=51605 RepID=A0A7I8JC83_SPIIN|nr:unnamed protein product [Spirodela intermedia]CAA6667739.1 unnamed protein product [Spirodela intermedia]
MSARAILPVLLLLSFICYCRGQLQVGFYADTCPDAEATVRSVVTDAFNSDVNTASGLLRLHFHDCIVDGCDGSVLINQPDGQQENRAFGHQGLRGFNVIDQAKAQLEATCPGSSPAPTLSPSPPGTPSPSNGPRYEVPTGRKDGLVSAISDFRAKGLSEKDLVLLSAAHTIGTTACFFMGNRLFNFRNSGGPDPSINPPFLQKLQQACPAGGDINRRIMIDAGSHLRFDTQIYANIRAGFAVLQSDAALYSHAATRPIVDSYLRSPAAFPGDFAAAIVKLGTVGVLTGSQGEIRNVCSSFN